jgi:anaerobic selenocysteine-containing dehydrogenase
LETHAFQRSSWDEALDEITSQFRQIAAKFGSEAILPYSYGGTLGKLGYASMDRRFFHRLGASQLARNICSEAGAAGVKSVYGVNMGTEPEQFAKSKYIIAWAANIHGNNVHLWPFVEEARRNGAKLIVIDPYRTRTAACADWHIPINPGTDVALALGMMHVIFKENLHDADYLSRHTLGFDDLRKKAQEYPPEKVAAWTGIAAADTQKLAREYATIRPAAIRMNYGVQRSENGGMAARTIAMLPCVTGSWKEVGGGFQLSTSGAFGLNNPALERPELMQSSALGRAARVINMVELGKALNDVNDPPVKAMFVYNSNPAAVCPDHNRVIQGLLRPDLFTIVHEQFFTDTTDYADIVLPATTFFEHKDLQSAYGHYYLQVSNQAIEPLGECRSNVEVFQALAGRMGFQEDCFTDSVDDMIDQALKSPNPWLNGLSRERMEKEGHVRLNFGGNGHASSEPFLPFADGNFRTAGGKALPIAKIRLKIDGVFDETKPVAADAKEVVFTTPLKAGTKTTMQSFCYDASGKELCGAYFAYVTRK